MSTHDDEPAAGITDDLLPEDLRPSDDNPLAKPLTDEDDPKSAEELDVLGGKAPEQSAADDSPREADAEGDEAHSED